MSYMWMEAPFLSLLFPKEPSLYHIHLVNKIIIISVSIGQHLQQDLHFFHQIKQMHLLKGLF